ncbi:MAG: hypothetical protein V1696_02955 [Candidatus Jorgensenbacteria bacterium]
MDHTWRLPIRVADKHVFLALKRGAKRLETRALNDPKSSRYYGNIAKGDTLLFTCGKSRLRRDVARVARYRSVRALFAREPFSKIAPWAESKAEAARMYDIFPGYRARIKKYGVVLFELR